MEQENCGCTPKNCTLIKEAPELRGLSFTMLDSNPGGNYYSINHDVTILTFYTKELYKQPEYLNNERISLEVMHLLRFMPIKVGKIIIESDNLEQFNQNLFIKHINLAGIVTEQAFNLSSFKTNTQNNNYLLSLVVDLNYTPDTNLVLFVPYATTTTITLLPAAVKTQ